MLFACSTKTQKASSKQAHPEGQRMADLGNGYFQNPILGGDYPDPSVLNVGDSVWYMTTSSFTYAPGLLIWKSYDLINWEPVCNALNTYIGSVFAPDLIEYKDTFYIYFPVLNTDPELGKRGFSNYVVKAATPEGPWSNPINLNIGKIDPGHVVDDEGQRWLYLSDGHLIKLSDDGTSVIGEMQKVYDGWEYPEDWVVEGFCLESPKLLKQNGYYYLTSAQGGTAGPPTSHMVVSARSTSVHGPWEHSPYNPIIRTHDAKDKWLSRGHGTIFKGPEDKWYCMYHGYQNGFYSLGRQTLLEPIEWTEDGWKALK